MIFGSMLGHLYDLGVCPFFTKYFERTCATMKNKYYNRMATIELRKLISRNRNYGIAQKYPLSGYKSTIPICVWSIYYEILLRNGTF